MLSAACGSFVATKYIDRAKNAAYITTAAAATVTAALRAL